MVLLCGPPPHSGGKVVSFSCSQHLAAICEVFVTGVCFRKFKLVHLNGEGCGGAGLIERVALGGPVDWEISSWVQLLRKTLILLHVNMHLGDELMQTKAVCAHIEDVAKILCNFLKPFCMCPGCIFCKKS